MARWKVRHFCPACMNTETKWVDQKPLVKYKEGLCAKCWEHEEEIDHARSLATVLHLEGSAVG